MKRCSKCKKTKPLENFSRAGKKGLQSWCKPCANTYAKERWQKVKGPKYYARRKAYYQKNRKRILAKQREYHLRNPSVKRKARLKEYGLTLEQAEQLKKVQQGRCAICGWAPSGTGRNNGGLHIDHDHATGLVRGLLCYRCNVALGHLADDQERMKRMIDYLISPPAGKVL